MTGRVDDEPAPTTHRFVQADVQAVLDAMAALGRPPMETLTVAEARQSSADAGTTRPRGPAVGEIVDGELPGPAGPLAYRLYRPRTTGPHPVVVYFHGGGWVLGNEQSDDPLCRDLCCRADMIIVSVGYRHAPEHVAPAAALDAFAATRWVAEHAAALGGLAPVLVAGWSAGGNLAAVVSRMARDHGGPALAGQVLINAATDSDLTRYSYVENAAGFGLTTSVMTWFWDLYTTPAQRGDWRVAPLRAAEFRNLPPAIVLTCDLDPLRDEGEAYAEVLRTAGVPVTSISGPGHTHMSAALVDVVASGEALRVQLAAAMRQLVAAAGPVVNQH